MSPKTEQVQETEEKPTPKSQEDKVKDAQEQIVKAQENLTAKITRLNDLKSKSDEQIELDKLTKAVVKSYLAKPDEKIDTGKMQDKANSFSRIKDVSVADCDTLIKALLRLRLALPNQQKSVQIEESEHID